jgi:hypothetical protein
MEKILIVSVVILSILCGFLAAGWFYAAKLIDRLTDKIMSRDYTDYRIGQGIKADEKTEEIAARTDAEEAKIEEDRSKGLLKTAHVLGGAIEDMGL